MVVFCQIARALKMVKQNCIQCWYQLTAVVTSVFETVALNIQLFLKRCKITQNKILT